MIALAHYWWIFKKFLKCLCQSSLVSNWARGYRGIWVADRHYGIVPFTVNHHRPVKPIRCRALTWLTKWNQPGSKGVAGITSVTMPLLSIIDLGVAAFHRSRTCWRWQAVWRERVELLIKLFGRFWEIVLAQASIHHLQLCGCSNGQIDSFSPVDSLLTLPVDADICMASSKNSMEWGHYFVFFMAMLFYPDQHSVSDPGANQLIQVPEKKSSHVPDAERKEGNERASESSDVRINICVTELVGTPQVRSNACAIDSKQIIRVSPSIKLSAEHSF